MHDIYNYVDKFGVLVVPNVEFLISCGWERKLK